MAKSTKRKSAAKKSASSKNKGATKKSKPGKKPVRRPARAAKKAVKKAVKKAAKKIAKKTLPRKAAKKAVKKAVKKTAKKAVQKSARKTAKKSAKKSSPAVRTQPSAARTVAASAPAPLLEDTATDTGDTSKPEAASGESAQSEEMLDDESDPMPAVGEAAPVFEARDQDGMRRNLTDFQGKWVLLYFYPKDGTSGCTKEACQLRDVHPEFEKLDAVVLGVSVDSVDSHFAFAEQHDLPFTLLSDEMHDIVKKYGVWQKKSYMGREYMGTLRTSFLINPEGRIARVYENVDPEGHAEEVLQDLQDLVEDQVPDVEI